MKINKYPSEFAEITGSTEIQYSVDEVNKIKNDFKESLSRDVALVKCLKRESWLDDDESIQMAAELVDRVVEDRDL